MQQQVALTSGYLSRDQTIDSNSNPLRNSLTKEVFSEKKSNSKDTIKLQSHSNSAILRKSNTALRPNGGSPRYQILSERDGVVLKRNQAQEVYSSLPQDNRRGTMPQDNSELMGDRSFDISVKEEHEIVRTCTVSSKWQEQISRKLSSQIRERIEPLLQSQNKKSAQFDYEALFSFTSQSFGVFIETQDEKQAECLNLIKNSYELLLKLSIEQMVTQNESLRFQVKQLLSQAKKKSNT